MITPVRGQIRLAPRVWVRWFPDETESTRSWRLIVVVNKRRDDA